MLSNFVALPWANKIGINHLTSEICLSLKNLKLYVWLFIFPPLQNKESTLRKTFRTHLETGTFLENSALFSYT